MSLFVSLRHTIPSFHKSVEIVCLTHSVYNHVSIQQLYGIATTFSHHFNIPSSDTKGSRPSKMSLGRDEDESSDLLLRYMLHPPTDMQQLWLNNKGVSREGLCRLLESDICTDADAVPDLGASIDLLFERWEIDADNCMNQDVFAALFQEELGSYHDLFFHAPQMNFRTESISRTGSSEFGRSESIFRLESIPRTGSPQFGRSESIFRTESIPRTGSPLPQRSSMIRSDSRNSLTSMHTTGSPLRSDFPNDPPDAPSSNATMRSMRFGVKTSEPHDIMRRTLRSPPTPQAFLLDRVWQVWKTATKDSLETQRINNLIMVLKTWQMYYCGGSSAGLIRLKSRANFIFLRQYDILVYFCDNCCCDMSKRVPLPLRRSVVKTLQEIKQKYGIGLEIENFEW